MLHLELPTGDDLAALATSPITSDTDGHRLAFRAPSGEANVQLQTRGSGGAGRPFETVQSLMVAMERVMNGRIDATAGAAIFRSAF